MTSKKQKHYSLYPKCVNKRIKDFVDFDYIAKLSPEDKDYLAKFSSMHYEANIYGDDLLLSPEQVESIRKADNARRKDIFIKDTYVDSQLETIKRESSRPRRKKNGDLWGTTSPDPPDRKAGLRTNDPEYKKKLMAELQAREDAKEVSQKVLGVFRQGEVEISRLPQGGATPPLLLPPRYPSPDTKHLTKVIPRDTGKQKVTNKEKLSHSVRVLKNTLVLLDSAPTKDEAEQTAKDESKAFLASVLLNCTEELEAADKEGQEVSDATA